MSENQEEGIDLSDDPTIPDSGELWRRIFPGWWIPDQDEPGHFRLSTQAFEDSKDGTPMSVTLAAESPGQGFILANFEGYGLASFTAGHARKCDQILQRAPTPEDPAHGYVVGRKTRSVKKCLLSGTTILAEPMSQG